MFGFIWTVCSVVLVGWGIKYSIDEELRLLGRN